MDEKQDAMVLINDSKDKWTVIEHRTRRSRPTRELKLGEKPLTILFAPKIKGT